jgi:hypothetical protein
VTRSLEGWNFGKNISLVNKICIKMENAVKVGVDLGTPKVLRKPQEGTRNKQNLRPTVTRKFSNFY